MASARSALAAIPATLVLVAAGSWRQPAQAVLTYNIFENGGDVVVQTSGSLNLPTSTGTRDCVNNGVLWSEYAVVCTGNAAESPSYSVTGEQSFTSAGDVVNQIASSAAGITTNLDGFSSLFAIDSSYVSGSPIISSSTYSSTTLSALGFTATSGLIGTWTLAGTGDTINIVIGPPAEVPGPLPLLGAGAAFGFSRRLRRRISASQATLPQA